ncbi:hypothetical protein CXG81DRAFT_19604 [Caulochytrium protostelioides]|uniref:Actin maturation protease n=1 Tax=Caulochytrium protostelioides TaxID=1555241 RepID=A0A4P9X5P9_9FUNG|nr:hypothetical protein CXG81DRAFT_19604 [Caulochytrium protostelioides]|eukprot:RKP00456.1 hypothetical protein CXG81DRAFT_19604 [Caulochytrium protostelioides]
MAPQTRQQGPSCGLWALGAALPAFRAPSEDAGRGGAGAVDLATQQRLLALAQSLGVSAYGECFSVAALADVAQHAIRAAGAPAIARVAAFPTAAQLVASLDRGGLLLVPYDRDRQNEPSCRGGHAAHWALIMGYVVDAPGRADGPAAGEPDPAADLVFVTGAGGGRGVPADHVVGVVAAHGMSLHRTVWDLAALRASNAQLACVSPRVRGAEDARPRVAARPAPMATTTPTTTITRTPPPRAPYVLWPESAGGMQLAGHVVLLVPAPAIA